jgi:hypothetical protein
VGQALPRPQVTAPSGRTECTRCRQPWDSALNYCGFCGWTPIGAHLRVDVSPAKKKKPWIDPSRSTRWAAAILFAALIWAISASGLIQEAWKRAMAAEAIPASLRGAWTLKAKGSQPAGRLTIDGRGRAKLEAEGKTLFGRASASPDGAPLMLSSFAPAGDEASSSAGPSVRPFLLEPGPDALLVEPEAKLTSDEERSAEAAARAEGFLSESGLGGQMKKIEGLLNEE